MHRLNNITITMRTILLVIVVAIVALVTIGFLYVFLQSIKPFFFEKPPPPSTILFDSSFDEVALFVKQRGEGLTVSSSSATLTNKEVEQTNEGR